MSGRDSALRCPRYELGSALIRLSSQLFAYSNEVEKLIRFRSRDTLSSVNLPVSHFEKRRTTREVGMDGNQSAMAGFAAADG